MVSDLQLRHKGGAQNNTEPHADATDECAAEHRPRAAHGPPS